jgi:hypothetical protein
MVALATESLYRAFHAHATGEWRPAALDELAALVSGVDADFGRRAT